MPYIRTTFRFLLLAVALTALVSCSDDNPGAINRETVAFVDIDPEPEVLVPGDTVRLGATPRSSTGGIVNGRTIRWTSADTTIATVSANGLVTAHRPGTTMIFAVVDGKTGSSALTVAEPLPPPVHAVDVLPVEVTALPSEIIQFNAVALDSAGMPLGREITWRSSNNAVALVDPSGLVLTVATGVAEIIATSEGKEGRGRVIVEAPRLPVARVEPTTGGVVSLYTGDSRQLGVRVYAADGTELFDRQVTWTSNAGSIATVSASGLVEAITVGNAIVVAQVESESASISIDVRSRITRIDQSPGSLVMAPGEDARIEAFVRDANGAPLQRTLAWTSTNHAVATVDAQGRVYAHGPGDATIKATAEGQEGWTHLRVVPWSQRPLQTIGDSALPATLITRTSLDNTGAVRTTRVVAHQGSLKLAQIGANNGRYEQSFSVWVIVDGQPVQGGQYVYRGDWHYDYFARQFVLQSYSGMTLTGTQLPDGTFRFSGRLEPNTAEVILVYAGTQ